jgi:hypothetical protein
VANTFGSEMSGGDLAPQLEACTAPNDEVAVTGILEQMLTAGLPPYLSEMNFHSLIVGEGFRSVHALRALKESHLRAMGLNMGEASCVFEVIKPVTIVLVQVQPEITGVAPVTARAAVKLGSLRPYPEHDAAGLPDVNGWQTYGLALQVCVGPAVTAQASEMFSLIDRSPAADMGAWVQGCPDDVVIWGAMLNSGLGSLPSALVVLLPGELKAAKAGMAIYRHIAKSVMTVSDEAIGIVLVWFQRPEAVQVANRHMLGTMLQQWLEARSKLKIARVEQSELVCRLSLDAVICKLPEVQADVKAMKAALNAIATAVTVEPEMIVAVIQGSADQYHSVAAQKKSVAALAAYGAVGAPVTNSMHIRCSCVQEQQALLQFQES